MNKKKHVLILGGSSDIGAEVIKDFLSLNWNVTAHFNKNSKKLLDSDEMSYVIGHDVKLEVEKSFSLINLTNLNLDKELGPRPNNKVIGLSLSILKI